MLAMQMQEAAARLMRDKELNWVALPLCGVFETKDRPIVMVGAFKQNPLRDICTALEIEDLSTQDCYADIDRQTERRADLQKIFRDVFITNTAEHWLRRLEEVDILSAPVMSLAEALADKQTAVNRMILDLPPSKAGPERWLVRRSACQTRR